MQRLRRFFALLRKEKLDRLGLILLVVALLGTTGLMLAEGLSPDNALWWSIVTLSTVGYGDITPTTAAGRLIAAVLMFFGIGLLGMFTASIASIFVERKIMADRGIRAPADLRDHVILCGWNTRARDILREIRQDRRGRTRPVVLIADLDHRPVDDDHLYFVHGTPGDETLGRARLDAAETVIVLGDDRLDDETRDARTVLTVLTIESINPDAYTIVDLVDERHAAYCRRAHADEIIVGNEFSSRLISRAAMDHGISRVLSDLVSARGEDLYRIGVVPELAGRPYAEVLAAMKQRHNCLVIAVERAGDAGVVSNPPSDLVVEAGDRLIVIAPGRPEL